VNRVSSPRCLVRERISRYAERGEVVEACMASVHIPFFMDGRPFRRLKQVPLDSVVWEACVRWGGIAGVGAVCAWACGGPCLWVHAS
jgi:hypothetical protein